MTFATGKSLKEILIVGFLALAGLLAGYAQAAGQDVSSLVSVTKVERTTTDLRTKLVTTISTITIKNTSSQSIGTPLQAVFDISAAAGQVQVPSAVAPGTNGNPYGKYYVDLSNNVSSGQLASSGSVTFSVSLVYSSSVRFTYGVVTYGGLTKAAPQLTWPNPSSIGYGTTLSATQLNATASVPGNFVYTPAAGALLPAGVQTLRADFTPTDTTKYSTASATVNITVNKAVPTLAWGAPAAIVYGAQLTATQLNATASVPGSFVYTPALGALLPAGPQTLRADFTPNDAANCSGASCTVTLTINKATPAISWGTPAAIGYGTALTSAQLNATASVPGSFVYTPALGAVLSAGNQTLKVDFTPADPADYAAASTTVPLTVTASLKPPQLSVDPLSYSVDQGKTITFNVSATHPDGNLVSISAQPPLTNATFAATPGVQATGSFSFTPDVTQSGIQMVSFIARDTNGLTDVKTVQIGINKINHAPSLSLPATAAVDQGKVVSIPVQASDPDGDLLTLTATGLPQNALFIPSTGTIAFAPDFTQTGTYNVIVIASDGKLQTQGTVAITVNSVTAGGGGQASNLVLNVDPVGSTSLQATQRITGNVNATGTTAAQPITSALITTLSPATGIQGQTLTVTLAGPNSGVYATHFASGISQASFGTGVTLNSLTIADSTDATVSITLDPGAAEGPRNVNVVTGNETAVSVVAFNVVKGKAGIVGKLTDTDSGQSVAGAVVVLQGTTISTLTGMDGTFSFTDVPTGQQTVIFNAPNHELVMASLVAQQGSTTDLGVVKSRATVFDPSAPPSLSLISLIGRGATGAAGAKTLKEVQQLFTDSWLLLGGQDAGVMDEYGNQLNPNVTGAGILSLTNAGTRGLAESVLRGESISLQEILFACSFGFNWGQGDPPALSDWIGRLQVMVNAAWADPSNPDSYLAILVFNNGTTLLKSPPTLSPVMRLSTLQANLLMASFCIYALDPEGNQSTRLGKPVMLAYNGDLLPTFLANIIPNPGGQGTKGTFRNFWKNYFLDQTNFPMKTMASAVGALASQCIAYAVTGGVTGGVVATALFSFVQGVAADILISALISLNIAVYVPESPLLDKVELTPATQDPANSVNYSVKVTFHRSLSDTNPAQDDSHLIHFYYILYRYSKMPFYQQTNGGEDTSAEPVAIMCSNCNGNYLNGNVLTINDNHAPQGALSYYNLTVTRTVGVGNPLTDDAGKIPTPWWGKLFPSGTLGLSGGKILGPGFLLTALSPMQAMYNNITKLTSDFSNPLWIYAGNNPPASADDLVVDTRNATDLLYYSDIKKKAIFRTEWLLNGPLPTQKFADTGFIDPGQTGLAIDSQGNLYTDNHASDTSFGGRIFQFTPTGITPAEVADLPTYNLTTFTRTYVGSVNYYSLWLQVSHPTSASVMAMGGVVDKNGLTVVDELEGSIKEVPVLAGFDPNRTVGQTVASISGLYVPPVVDLAFDADMNLYILANPMAPATPSLWTIQSSLNSSSGLSPVPYLSIAGLVGRGIRGLAIDGSKNIYVSVQDADDANLGKVFMYPRSKCMGDSTCEPIMILQGLKDPGKIRISKDGRALYVVTSGAQLEKHFFGIAGQIKDTLGSPLAGAKVTFETFPLGCNTPVTTNASGNFTAFEVFRSDLVDTNAKMTISYQDKIAPVFVLPLGQDTLKPYGEAVRDITCFPDMSTCFSTN